MTNTKNHTGEGPACGGRSREDTGLFLRQSDCGASLQVHRRGLGVGESLAGRAGVDEKTRRSRDDAGATTFP